MTTRARRSTCSSYLRRAPDGTWAERGAPAARPGHDGARNAFDYGASDVHPTKKKKKWPWRSLPRSRSTPTRSTTSRSRPTAARCRRPRPEAGAEHREPLRRPGPQGLLRRPHVPPGGAGLRDPGRRPRRQRPRRSRLQVRRRAGEGRVHARRRGDGQRRPEHQRVAVLHLHRRLHPQAHQELQPVRLRVRASTSPSRPRSATSCGPSTSKNELLSSDASFEHERRPGIFGPDSVAWRIHADPAMLIGGLRRCSCRGSSRGPWPRSTSTVRSARTVGSAQRTTQFVLATTYGDTEAAEAAAAIVRKVHSTSTASTPSLARRTRRTTPTSCCGSTRSRSSRSCSRTAPTPDDHREDGDRYVTEMARVAEMVELPPGRAPRTEGELRDYLQSVRGLQATPAALEGLASSCSAEWTCSTGPVGHPDDGGDRHPAGRTRAALPHPVVPAGRSCRCAPRCSRSAGCSTW